MVFKQIAHAHLVPGTDLSLYLDILTLIAEALIVGPRLDLLDNLHKRACQLFKSARPLGRYFVDVDCADTGKFCCAQQLMQCHGLFGFVLSLAVASSIPFHHCQPPIYDVTEGLW